jgi:putative FmdB family regulatory protein
LEIRGLNRLPTYEYRCTNGHTFEVVQSMTADPVTACTVCGQPVQRVFHPVAVHFKGSGFYTTDYGRNRSASSDSGGDSSDSSSSDSKSDSKSGSGDGAKKAEKKVDAAKSD